MSKVVVGRAAWSQIEVGFDKSLRPIRVGVAGPGFGASVHVPALKHLPGIEDVALADRDPDRSRAVANRMGAPHAGAPAMALVSLKSGIR